MIINIKYKAKLLGNTVAQPNPNQANEILRNATIAVLLKYLNNFWRSLEMPLINCKVESKLKWTKYCVLSAAGDDNDNNINNDDNGHKITRHKILCRYCNFISNRQPKTIKTS